MHQLSPQFTVVCDCLSFCTSFLCPPCDVISPFFLLSSAFSFYLNRSLKNSVGESIGPYNMSIPSSFSFFHYGK